MFLVYVRLASLILVVRQNFQTQIIPTLFKRLFRVYAHLYHEHFTKMQALGAEAHLNTCFKQYRPSITNVSVYLTASQLHVLRSRIQPDRQEGAGATQGPDRKPRLAINRFPISALPMHLWHLSISPGPG